MPPAKPVQQRKRNRKRKRRAASSSESSSESSSDESTSPRVAPKVQPVIAQGEPELDESDESSSSSDSDSASDSEADLPRVKENVRDDKNTSQEARSRRRSPSASPPAATIPPFPPTSGVSGQESVDEQALKEKFRKFWMSSIADGFKDDLDVTRKEPNMTSSRLGLLIESLAAGADVFGSTSDNNQINEMEIVLDQPTSP
ncbi:hypothetical protein OE88DRAFT_1244701 [Heliocybe sulcata]|uniref:Ribosome assembly protein 3 n=1 Tax=Heliocybe sulcata TaxID=5364 RepID=A0A5C3N6R7_9AGAM|nr:hypothetical protein OE88DRAFT_1244701 [Heliocybe sulcata]